MSIKNGKDYLYLVWKSTKTRQQYIIGQLSKNGTYEFKYSNDIQKAIDEGGFNLLVSFNDTKQLYTNDELFPAFSSRLPDRKRKDIKDILAKYGLEKYDAYELLKKSGAKLPIDNLQFIDPILDVELPFEKTFYIAGTRHYIGCDGRSCECSKITVTRGDELFLFPNPCNEFDSNAIQLLNDKNQLIGYVPRYYCEALLRFIKDQRKISCHVRNFENKNNCSECIQVILSIK